MKTKIQKNQELKEGKELLKKAKVLVFTDFGKLTAEELRKFRRELRGLDAELKVMKKRLFGVLLKDQGIEFNAKEYKVSVGAIFSEKKLEDIAGPIYRFFKNLGSEKEKILGGFDVAAKQPVDQKTVLMIGALPSREILLGQLLGMIAAPIRSFLYVLDQKSKQTVENKQ